MASSLEKSLQALSVSANDTSAQVFQLLDQDNFAKALETARSKDAKQVPALYIAYALYRLGREEECLRTLGDAKDRASLHLKAQALYRLERVTPQELSTLKAGTKVANELADIEVNALAIAAQRAALSRPIDHDLPSTSTLSSHESYFNYSVLLSFLGKTEAAIENLHSATKALKSLGLDEEEYESELAPINAQLAHLTEDAALNEQTCQLKTDASTRFLSGINFLNNDNPFAVYKAYDAGKRLKPSARLFSYQDRFIAYDKIVAMHSVGLSIKRAVARYVSKYATDEPGRCAALKSLMYAKTSTESLKDRVARDPTDIDAVAALIGKTVRSRQGVSKAISIIENLPEDVRHQCPGLLGIWVALSNLTPNSQASTILDNALKNASGSTREELLAGSIKSSLAQNTKLDDPTVQERARELFQLNPDNIVAQSYKSMIESDESPEIMQLPDLSSVDIVGLELGSKRSLESDAPQQQPKQKKQKVKTPEQIQAASKLDPERWLPKRDRSNYKPSKKEKLRASGGHQGGIVDETLSSQAPVQTTMSKSGEVARKKKNKKGKK